MIWLIQKYLLILVLLSLLEKNDAIRTRTTRIQTPIEQAVTTTALLFNFRGGDDNDDDNNILPGSKPNPYVTMAPLIIAIVCKDGVAMVAVHNNNKEYDENWFHHENYREEVRIKPIDGKGTALMSCGWRPDAEWVASISRKLIADEVGLYGTSSNTIFAQDLSLWMAEPNRARAPSVANLVASSDDGCVWLIDMTGSYRVRAHALGKGDSVVNSRILCTIDFTKLTSEEGLDRLLDELLKLKEKEENDDEEEETWEPLPENTPIECAIVQNNQFKRILSRPFLGQKARTIDK
mmetsp:Transcript_32323/g.36784  ORF Transcript_32323/g.36784 Transcript_32323/m.36784 type:complete len:293 (-) Transcript_32323:22-900(-)